MNYYLLNDWNLLKKYKIASSDDFEQNAAPMDNYVDNSNRTLAHSDLGITYLGSMSSDIAPLPNAPHPFAGYYDCLYFGDAYILGDKNQHGADYDNIEFDDRAYMIILRINDQHMILLCHYEKNFNCDFLNDYKINFDECAELLKNFITARTGEHISIDSMCAHASLFDNPHNIVLADLYNDLFIHVIKMYYSYIQMNYCPY